jgi:hypothetical protein
MVHQLLQYETGSSGGLNDMVPDEVYLSFQHEKQEVIAA